MRPIAFVLLLASSASAAVPPYLNLQGQLANTGGGVDGTYLLTVSIYKKAAGGTALYTEGHPDVDVQAGVFSLTVGETVALPEALLATAEELWVALKVEGEPELPRSRLASVAYALVAKHADVAASLEGPAIDLACTGCVGATDLAPGVFAPVAFSGSYGDLDGVPKLALVATSGVYSDLLGAPALADVATSGDYGDLSGAPKLSLVATTGEYGDLSGTPDLSKYAALAGLNTFTAGQTFAAGLTVGAATVACTAAIAGRVRFDAATGYLLLCDGAKDRRIKLCSDGCPNAALVACGQPIQAECGDPCAGTGTLCAAGLECSGGSCHSTLGTAANPATSCKAIHDADATAKSGTFWLKPGATAFQGTCEMSKADGGWTKVRSGHTVHGQSFPDQTAINAEGFAYTQILFVYLSGSATGGPNYPSSLPGSNPVGFKLSGKNWGGPTGWSASTCGVPVDTYTAAYFGSDFTVDVGATSVTFQVALLEGMSSCTTSDNSGPATMDVYVR